MGKRAAINMNWTYDSTVERRGVTLHVWSAPHRDGYTAFTLTHQPHMTTRLDFVKPTGSGHFDSLEAALR